MTEPLRIVNFSFAPQYAISPNGKPDQIRYAGDWVYLYDALGVTRVNAMTQAAQYVAVGWKKGQKYYYPGRYSTGVDSYQCVSYYRVSPKWLVTVYNGSDAWKTSSGVLMLPVQVYRVNETNLDWHGQFELPERRMARCPFTIGGDLVAFTCPDTAPGRCVFNLDTLAVLSANTPVTPDEQPGVGGYTYSLSATGQLDSNVNTQEFTLTRSDVAVEPPPVQPPAPPVVTPPPPTPPVTTPPGTPPPGTPPPYVPPPVVSPPVMGYDMRLGGRFNVTCRWHNTAPADTPALAWKLPGLDGGYFTFFSANNPEIFVKYADLTPLPGGQHGLSFAKATTVDFVLTVTDIKTGTVKKILSSDIPDPAWVWFAA